MPSGAVESKKIMRHGKKVPHGKSIIERLELQMDKRRTAMEDAFVKKQKDAYILQKGRYQGIGQSIALMRSSSLEHEIERSNERLGIE